MSNWHEQLNRKLHLSFQQPEWVTSVAARITLETAHQQAMIFKDAGFQAVEVFVYDHHGLLLLPV
jgi:hypothetical protein